MRSMNRTLSAITPMVMMATLPETLQDQVVQHLCKYLERCEYSVATDDEILKHAKDVQGNRDFRSALFIAIYPSLYGHSLARRRSS